MPTPNILQIYREPLKLGSEACYQEIEEDTARISATLGCPHPYLGLESVTGPKEIWWFNGFESAEKQSQVYKQYASNAPLMAALQRNSERKADLILSPIQVIANYREDLSIGVPWIMGNGRFVVISTMWGQPAAGTVFETSDGERICIAPAQTREQATTNAASFGRGANIFAARPSWSFPDAAWIEADPMFWQ